MRFLFIVALLIIQSLIFISCDSSVEPIIPNTEPGILNLQKLDTIYTPIKLPQRSPLFEDSVYSISVDINGSQGGRITYENYYISTEGDSISFYFNLFIPKMAFQGMKTITATFDSVYAAIHFTPSMAFDSTLHLFQGFTGLDLTGMHTGTLDFVYMNDDGTIELIKEDGVQVIIPQGIVRVMNAELKHFSRYGWIRKSTVPKVYQDQYAE